MFFKNLDNVLKEKTLDNDKKGDLFEKGDFIAMMIAAFLTLFPVLLFVFLIFGIVSYALFA